MTQVFKQTGQYDCMACVVAMAAQIAPGKIFHREIFDILERDKGFNRSPHTTLQRMMAYAGFIEDVDYFTHYVVNINPKGPFLQTLKGRRALLQVKSLNQPPPAMHMVYWDGQELHDPSNGQVYRWLEQLYTVEHLYLFRETAPQQYMNEYRVLSDKMRLAAHDSIVQFWCPACDEMHEFPSRYHSGGAFTWDWNRSHPSTDSFWTVFSKKKVVDAHGKWTGELVRDGEDGSLVHSNCQFKLVDGKITYGSDSTHELKDQKDIPMAVWNTHIGTGLPSRPEKKEG